MDITDAAGFPDSTHIESASPHELSCWKRPPFTQYAPGRIIGEKCLRQRWNWWTVLGWARNRCDCPASQKGASTNHQDGRNLCRYYRRWRVDRMFAWFQNFRRLVLRWQYHAYNFRGLLQLGCSIILLRLFWDDFKFLCESKATLRVKFRNWIIRKQK